jgi:hypothetical protein
MRGSGDGFVIEVTVLMLGVGPLDDIDIDVHAANTDTAAMDAARADAVARLLENVIGNSGFGGGVKRMAT